MIGLCVHSLQTEMGAYLGEYFSLHLDRMSYVKTFLDILPYFFSFWAMNSAWKPHFNAAAVKAKTG